VLVAVAEFIMLPALSAEFMEYNIKNTCSILYKIRVSVGLSALNNVFFGVRTSLVTNKRSTSGI